MTIAPASSAVTTSSRTLGEAFAAPERIMTKSFASPIASTIVAPQSPKPTSRGAIQQRMPASSSRWQTASAAALSAMV
jgi:hypothetical protein